MVSEFEWSPDRWRTVTSRQQGLYRSTIALTLTEQPRDFHTGAPLTHETIDANRVDDHHVFPRAYLADIDRGPRRRLGAQPLPHRPHHKRTNRQARSV